MCKVYTSVLQKNDILKKKHVNEDWTTELPCTYTDLLLYWPICFVTQNKSENNTHNVERLNIYFYYTRLFCLKITYKSLYENK